MLDGANRRIAILGGNSFSGSWTIRALSEMGHELVVINRSKEIEECYRPYNKAENIKIFTLGSNYLPRSLVEICDEFEVGSLINFSAQSMVAESWNSPWDWYETNVVWLSRLTAELLKWGNLERWIQFSTPEVYGSTSDWIKESTNFNPSSPYAISRAAGDWHLLAEHKRSNLPVIFTRASNVYGPFQQKYRIIPRCLIAAAIGERINLHGGGTSIRSFIHISDVTSALIKILKLGKIGETYHISTTELVEIRQVVQMAYTAYDLNAENYVNVVKERDGKDFSYHLDSDKVRNTLKWNDRVKLEEGLLDTKKWVDTWIKELVEAPSEYSHQA